MNRVGRPLTPQEIASYDVLPAHLARRVRVITVPTLPGGYVGMTIGFNVFVTADTNTEGDSALLAHELVHVRQWAETGLANFPFQYMRSFMSGLWRQRNWMAAYRSIEAEQEARIETTDWLRRRTRSLDEPNEA